MCGDGVGGQVRRESSQVRSERSQMCCDSG
jgi:hypothetical protein